MRDDIADFLKRIPLKDMKESQVGNYIYSGKGKLYVGTVYRPVTIYIRLSKGETVMSLSAPTAGILVKCPFEPGPASKTIREAIKKSLN